jgi:hypothetical protein
MYDGNIFPSIGVAFGLDGKNVPVLLLSTFVGRVTLARTLLNEIKIHFVEIACCSGLRT